MKKLASIILSMLMMISMIAGASAETFTGDDTGIGPVTVTLTVEDGKIVAAEVTGENETKGFGYEPIYEGKYAEAIVAAQGADIDNIASVTVTTNAVIAATKEAMVAAGLEEAEVVVVEDVTCDVVVVGAGGAGMAAALQLADNGVENIILIEKTGSTGGNTSRATGGMNAAESKYQGEREWKDATTAAVEKTIASAKENYGEQLADLIATVEEQLNAYKANPVGYFDSVELFALDTMVGGKGIKTSIWSWRSPPALPMRSTGWTPRTRACPTSAPWAALPSCVRTARPLTAPSTARPRRSAVTSSSS